MIEVLTYEALKADRDAQQKRADALAVENAERGEIIERMIGIFGASGYHAVQNSIDPCSALMYDAMQALKSPVAGAALAEVEAKAIEKFAAHLHDQAPHVEGCDMESYEVFGHLATEFAAELREAK